MKKFNHLLVTLFKENFSILILLDLSAAVDTHQSGFSKGNRITGSLWNTEFTIGTRCHTTVEGA